MKDEEDLYGGSTECETDDEDEKDQGTLMSLSPFKFCINSLNRT